MIRDPARPGRSSLVWTAAHCLHAGREGGWFRNISFVPSFGARGKSTAAFSSGSGTRLAPLGHWWADGAATSDEWRAEGTVADGAGAPFDFAVLHVTPPPGTQGRSLEEIVGAAVPVAFASRPATVGELVIWGYPEGTDATSLRL
ncbi:trypsin-like serine peptidase [Streptomyces sp. NPDC049687]|uniref:trypsin-like serine peptidase n=1 Tax=Streptomyces sp. NPDC049687 TaxID=3365596 RepID=UPI0037A65514